MKSSMASFEKTHILVLPKIEKIYRRIIEYGILGLIVFSPLPAASVYEWSILVIQLTVFLMVLVYVLMNTRPDVNENLLQIMKWPKYLFSGFFIFLLFQIIPLPVALVKIISPNSYNFRESFSAQLSSQKFMSISLIPSHTFREGLELLSYVLLGFLILMTVNKKQIKRIYYVLISMGVFQAFYGMFELYSKNPRILFYKKIYSLDSVTGTFVNRNHFSGYVEMILPLAMGLIVARVDVFSMVGMSWREKFLRLSEKGLAVNLMVVFGILAMSLAIVFSKSRSGVFLLLYTFVLFLGLSALFYRNFKGRKQRVNNILKFIFFALIGISFYVGVDFTLDRFSMDNILMEKRPEFWEKTVQIFADYPLFGSGLGTFPSIYPGLESLGTPLNIYHAHNDYLEYLAELGILGMGMLLGGLLIMVIKAFMIWRTRRHREIKGLALGGFVALICLLLHSITDFNMHIPANMLLFSIVLSLTAVVATYRYRSPDDKKDVSKIKEEVSKIIARNEKRKRI